VDGDVACTSCNATRENVEWYFFRNATDESQVYKLARLEHVGVNSEFLVQVTFQYISLNPPDSSVFDPSNLTTATCYDPICVPYADIVFSIDTNIRVKEAYFLYVRQFCESVMKSMKCGRDYANFALTNFSDVLLNMSGDWSAIANAIENMPLSNSDSFLEYSFTTIRNAFNSSLRDTPNKVGIIITDVEPTSTSDAQTYSQMAKDAGIELFIIGVGSFKTKMMASLASPDDHPFMPHFLNVNSFNDLSNLFNSTLAGICQGDRCNDL